MKLLTDKIIQPLLSEKVARRESKLNEFTIVVAKEMTKPEIAKAVEQLFGVKPTAVRTAIFPRRSVATATRRSLPAATRKPWSACPKASAWN